MLMSVRAYTIGCVQHVAVRYIPYYAKVEKKSE